MNYTKLRQIAKEKGVSLTHLSAILGKQRSYIHHLESTNANPPDEIVDKIANELGTTSAYLTDETDDPSPDDAELLSILDELRNDPDRRMLFHTLKGCTKEDILQAVKIIEALKK